jgi:DNA-binding protein HU-beta
MNKKELVDAMAAKAEISKSDAEKALAAFTDVVMETVKQGDKVSLVGFGTFERRERAARNGVNPATGKAIKIAASKVPAFKSGKGFKEFVK